jgi:hypothetical protein
MTSEICDSAVELLSRRLANRRLSVRLLGVGVSGLVHSPQVQRLLFDADQQAVQTDLDRATDQIRARFGTDALRRASGLLHEARHEPMPRPEHGPR